jgi:hypothetical protein
MTRQGLYHRLGYTYTRIRRYLTIQFPYQCPGTVSPPPSPIPSPETRNERTERTERPGPSLFLRASLLLLTLSASGLSSALASPGDSIGDCLTCSKSLQSPLSRRLLRLRLQHTLSPGRGSGLLASGKRDRRDRVRFRSQPNPLSSSRLAINQLTAAWLLGPNWRLRCRRSFVRSFASP